jgi:hypothetical protein
MLQRRKTKKKKKKKKSMSSLQELRSPNACMEGNIIGQMMFQVIYIDGMMVV